MNRKSLMVFLLIGVFVSSACSPPVAAAPVQSPIQSPNGSSVEEPSEVHTDNEGGTATTSETSGSNHAAHVDVLDPTHLTLGDNKTSSSPRRDYIYSCNANFNSGEPAATGWWLNGDGTWDLTQKAVVDGTVSWPHNFTISINGEQRVISGNNLPDHTTGIYPINSNDDAYQVDRNPNSISTHDISINLPLNPIQVATSNCVGGEVGILLSGILIFNGFDAAGRDAAAHEVQDGCNGHPQQGGFYHYHSLSECIEDTPVGHSALMGYAFDGFGIFGYYGEDGIEITNADLDECHGHTHSVEWDDQQVEMYHYHATREFPYTVGCFRGEPVVRALSNANNGQQGPGGPLQPGIQQPGEPQGTMGGTPPRAAFQACANLPLNAGCSFISPNGIVNGTCLNTQGGGQTACVPR